MQVFASTLSAASVNIPGECSQQMFTLKAALLSHYLLKIPYVNIIYI